MAQQNERRGAVGYVRVSTQEQADKGVSLTNQKAKLEAYCELNGLDLIRVIEDAGASGKDLKRDGMQELLSLVRSGRAGAVVVYKLDRLSRRVLDTLALIESFEKAGVEFHSINERLDTSTALGRFFLNLTAALAQMERDVLRERTSDALQGKKARGERAGQIPFGYRLARDGVHLVKEPAEQKAMGCVATLREKGYSLREICEALEKSGLSPRGKRWHPQTVSNILKQVA